jgi:PKD repeat protein
VPGSRWGALEPRAIIGDQTRFSFHTDPGPNDPFWFAVDIENGWVFTVTGRALQIFDARTNPGSPDLAGYGYAADTKAGNWCPTDGSAQTGGLMPCWQHSDEDWFLRDLDAPPGVDDIVAIAGRDQGFSAWDTSNKGKINVHYQDEGTFSQAVYATTIGGTDYAFSLNSTGVTLYDLTAARNATRCRQVRQPPCASGVLKGKLPGVGGGAHIDGTGNFIIIGRNFLGFEIWNVSTPTAPVLVMTSPAQHAGGVALWKSGSSHFAAHVGFGGKLFVYDVSCIASGLCAAPLPMAQVPVPGGSAPLLYLTSSSSNGTPFLHVGGDDTFSCKPQREYLFKMSNPAQPEDVTPQGHPDGYWGWYYEGCSTGFNWVSPIMGKFGGGSHFYRSAYSLLDVHELAGAQPPAANFTWSPSEIYPGTPVDFTDLSTGGPNAWSWTFADGSPGTSSAEDPAGITFSSPGQKSVTLQAFNPNGDDVETKSITVIDPMPAVASVSVSPPGPLVCQPVTFTANGATGQPVLGFAWDVKSDATQTSVFVGAGNPLVWAQIPPGLTPGSYTATVTVSNGAGNAAKSATFTVTGLATLPGDDAFTPTNDAFVAGTVQFHVNAPGATEWNWDFEGDGFSEADWTNDPVAGPNPLHSYTTTGTRQVRVKVRNCVNQIGATSAPLEVVITQITPLQANFSYVGGAQCITPQFCTANAGATITFADASTGADFWDYDWDGNGTYEDAGNTAAKTSHVYPTQSADFFQPKLRVRRGASEESVFVLPQSFKIDPAGPAPTPSITIGGPSSGAPNADLTFTATAQNCTPSATGWNWNTGGGTLTGSGSTVKIKWSSTGTKSISVTNTGCAGATGAKSVTIGSGGPPPPPPPPPPGGLTARFTYSPAAPKAGEAVSFNGSTSSGSPTAYTWSFGDGSALVSGPQATASHTYTNPGIYLVSLSVINTNSACPPAPFCESSTTQQLVVVPSTPPPAASFTTSVPCTSDFGLVVCNATAGEPVGFTDTSTGGPVATRTWDFGDGQTSSEAAPTHVFVEPGSYVVALTVGNAGGASSATRTFVVAEAPVSRSVVLPWIAQTRGVLVQSSDLYVHNPGDEPLEVVVTFLRRGTPETNPPEETLTIAPHATQFYADVIRDLFERENIAGFIMVEPQGNGPAPIMTSFNTTFQTDGSKFGQTIAGAFVESQEESSLDPVRHLVGLNSTTERLAYMGVSNPNPEPATYRLAFFDKLGEKIAESADIVLARFGQQQFQPKQLETQFGLSDLDDYRVEVRSVTGAQLFPYGANLRQPSGDPSFVAGGRADEPVVHLLGVFGTAGLNNSKWQTDVVLANSSEEVVLLEIGFQSVGVDTPPEDVVRMTLQPRETTRIENVLDTLWGLDSAVGTLTFESDSEAEVYPTIVAEIYDNADPEDRFGQSMSARPLAEAAKAGESQHLIGLRQDAEYRSTISLFNPGTEQAVFDVIYRRLDGTELPALANVTLGPGRSRQLNPGHHPLPEEGVADGFSVEIKVKSGRVLAGGQVVNNQTNDPAYIQGETR